MCMSMFDADTHTHTHIHTHIVNIPHTDAQAGRKARTASITTLQKVRIRKGQGASSAMRRNIQSEEGASRTCASQQQVSSLKLQVSSKSPESRWSESSEVKSLLRSRKSRVKSYKMLVIDLSFHILISERTVKLQQLIQESIII